MVVILKQAVNKLVFASGVQAYISKVFYEVRFLLLYLIKGRETSSLNVMF